MAWVWLLVAIVLEVLGTTALKSSEGFSRLVPSLLVAVFYGASFYCLSKALIKIDVGVGYAIWSGVGTVLIVGIGVFWFEETLGAMKLLCVGLIVIGVVGLKLSMHP